MILFGVKETGDRRRNSEERDSCLVVCGASALIVLLRFRACVPLGCILDARRHCLGVTRLLWYLARAANLPNAVCEGISRRHEGQNRTRVGREFEFVFVARALIHVEEEQQSTETGSRVCKGANEGLARTRKTVQNIAESWLHRGGHYLGYVWVVYSIVVFQLNGSLADPCPYDTLADSAS